MLRWDEWESTPTHSNTCAAAKWDARDEGRAAHLQLDGMHLQLNQSLPHVPRSCESSSFSKPFPPIPLVSAGWDSIAVALPEARAWANNVCKSTLLSQRQVVAALSQLARGTASLEHLPPLLDGVCLSHVPLSRSARRAVSSKASAHQRVAGVLVKVHADSEFQEQPARQGCRWTTS